MSRPERAVSREQVREALTVADLRRRPTITIREYAAFVGVSKDTAYEAAARGELRVLHLGRRVIVPTAPVLESLGLLAVGPESERAE